jgi:hypothetical protein
METFRNGEMDVDLLCSELRARARCSEGGVVVSEEDVNGIFCEHFNKRPSPPNVYTPQITVCSSSQTYGTPGGPVFISPSDYTNGVLFTPGFEADIAEILASQNGMDPAMVNDQQMPNNTASPLNSGSFQQPFVPQVLWQTPITFEWDKSAPWSGLNVRGRLGEAVAKPRT